MILLCLLAAVSQPTEEIRHFQETFASFNPEFAKILLKQFHDTVINIASYTNHGILNGIFLIHILLKMICSHSPQLLFCSKNRIRQGMTAVCRFSDQVMHHIIRSILIHGDFLQDHILLFSEFILVHQRTEEHIR
ncbi:hypothetical protein D3C85_1074260 [compost metagenome]